MKSAVFCTIVALLTFETSVSAQKKDTDFGLLTICGANISPVKGLKISAGGSLTTSHNFSKLSETRGECYVDYKFCKYLTANTGYVFIYKTLSSTPRHRWLAGLTGSLPVGITNFELRERYQETHTVGKSVPDRLLRNRFRFTVNIPNSIFSPYVSFESLVSLNEKSLWDVTQVRYDIGTKMKIDRHSISVYWRIFHNMKASAPYSMVNLLAVSYHYTIKLK